MAAGEHAQAHRVDVFLGRDTRDVLGALAQSRVNHLGAGVAQRQRDHLGADIMAIEAGLGDQDALAAQDGYLQDRSHNRTGSWNSPHCDLRRCTISPTVA